ncbi:MAG: RluA family pseudouridine synthase [Alphaproteobacteria bacterium]|nr:RluA family pseudouridine synthase [Alphaproteobacteria bacterium]
MSATVRTVIDDEADIRLDRWLRRHFPALPQALIERLCRTGQLRVDGQRAAANTRLAPGQAVRVPPLADRAAPPFTADPDPALAREAARMVLYRDDDVIVLNKPHGLPVQGGPGISRHLDRMLDGLRFDRLDRPRLVHRLDRDTSGVLVLARTPGVAAKLAAAFRGRDVHKTYWSVVQGRPVPPEGRIDLDLARTGRRTDRIAPAAADDPAAARAITDYRTLDHAGRRFAWLELQPLTGRMHQLRVHCAALGVPILGDDKYGPAAPQPSAEPLHLHARRLALPHPAGGTLVAEADLPPHMRETFARFGFAAPAAQPARRI